MKFNVISNRKALFHNVLPWACFSLSWFCLATAESVSAESAFASSLFEAVKEAEASSSTSLSSNFVSIGISSLISYLYRMSWFKYESEHWKYSKFSKNNYFSYYQLNSAAYLTSGAIWSLLFNSRWCAAATETLWSSDDEHW